MKTKKILVADDHAILRQGVVKIIEGDNLFEVVAESDNGLDAFDKIKKIKPDIAILDITMPGMTGLEVARKIKEEGLNVKIIILTVHTGRNYFEEALDCDIKGYVLKQNTAHDLISALHSVIDGKRFISSLLSEYLLKSDEEKQSFNEKFSLDDLSPTEKRILTLISENKTSKEIGEQLHLSTKTIQNHRAHICTKMGLSGWNALLTFAVENKAKL